jgi:hypothetical protein
MGFHRQFGADQVAFSSPSHVYNHVYNQGCNQSALNSSRWPISCPWRFGSQSFHTASAPCESDLWFDVPGANRPFVISMASGWFVPDWIEAKPVSRD